MECPDDFQDISLTREHYASNMDTFLTRKSLEYQSKLFWYFLASLMHILLLILLGSFKISF